MTQSVDIAVVRKSVTVDVDQRRAFEVFVTNLGTWWPGEYHIGAADMRTSSSNRSPEAVGTKSEWTAPSATPVV